MTTVRLLSIALCLLALSGCGGDPPPEREPRSMPVRRTGEEVPPPAEGLLAPIDEWKKRLAEMLPKPWKLANIEQQIPAPPGWTRFEGPRGLRLDFTDGKETQQLWVMGATFEGKTVVDDAAVSDKKNDSFWLFRTPEDAKGWTHTAVVAAALGLDQAGG